jgi:hypothetical protein
LLPVLLAARLMGGRGSRQQVSPVLLAFLPQALVFFSSFNLGPEVGSLWRRSCAWAPAFGAGDSGAALVADDSPRQAKVLVVTASVLRFAGLWA